MAIPANEKSLKNYKGAGWEKLNKLLDQLTHVQVNFFSIKKQYLDITPMSCILYLLNKSGKPLWHLYITQLFKLKYKSFHFK